MNCSKCNTHNDPTYRFCIKCGAPLASQGLEDATKLKQSEITDLDRAPKIQQSSARPVQRDVPPQQQPANVYQQPQQRPTASQIGQAVMNYGKQGVSTLNIWGPFAGFGTRRKHIGWLMDNKGEQANELTIKVNEKFKSREIPGTQFQHQTLVAKGVFVEKRPYFILQRGLTSLGLHIGQFGKDLFISIVSYLKPPISSFRVIILAAMVLFWLYMSLIFPNSLNNAVNNIVSGFNLFSDGAPSGDSLFPLLCIIGPLGTINSLALFFFLIFSIYKYVTEKDFLAGLRVSPNEFNEDDLMAMEKAVEQTVRIALDEIGLDPNDLKPTDVSGRRLI